MCMSQGESDSEYDSEKERESKKHQRRAKKLKAYVKQEEHDSTIISKKLNSKKGGKKRKRDSEDEKEESVIGERKIIDIPGPERKVGRLARAVTGEKSKAVKRNGKERPMISEGAMRKRLKAAEKDAGKLSRLIDAPLDIWYEIAQDLSPLDLLSLSRISRQFRNFMLSKESRLIWTIVRRRLKMPDCPEFMSEAEYMSLVFEKECYACGGLRIKYTNFPLRVRFCDGCWKLNCPRGHILIRKEYGKKVEKTKEIYSLLPNSWDDRLSPGEERKPPTYVGFTHYYAPDLLDVVENYLTLTPGTVKMQRFLEQQWERRLRISDFAGKIENWVRNNLP